MTAAAPQAYPFGWIGILRLALVQAALGSIVVLCTSTLNRVMVVEMAQLAVVPGALVALHYAVQMLRPRMGHGSDVGGRRTPWIVGGMALLALSAVLATVGTLLMGTQPLAGLALAVLAFVGIGLGVGASGTTVLALLATRVAPGRRAAAATITWTMMILGIVITAATAGSFLDPFSPARLLTVAAAVAGTAVAITLLAVWGLEGRGPSAPTASAASARTPFRQAFREVWNEGPARRFTLFVFLSMLAYNTQDLILEPFAGLVFGYTPGESTKLAGVQHGGVLLGMLLVGVVGTLLGRRRRLASLGPWIIGGCGVSALAALALALGGLMGPGFPLQPAVFVLGAANGAFAVAAIGSMMERAGSGRERREGTRMGLWGAAQAIAFGTGGFLGTVAVDGARQLLATPGEAYGAVFAFQAALFLASGLLAARLDRPAAAPAHRTIMTDLPAGAAGARG